MCPCMCVSLVNYDAQLYNLWGSDSHHFIDLWSLFVQECHCQFQWFSVRFWAIYISIAWHCARVASLCMYMCVGPCCIFKWISLKGPFFSIVCLSLPPSIVPNKFLVNGRNSIIFSNNSSKNTVSLETFIIKISIAATKINIMKINVH